MKGDFGNALRTHAQRLSLWLRAVGSWFLEDYRIWLPVIAVLAALAYVFLRKGVTEPEVRYTGLVLQILGLFIIGLGIHATRLIFGRPAIFAWLRQRFHQFPRYGGRVVSANHNTQSSGASMQGPNRISYTAASSTIGSFADALEKDLSGLAREIEQIETELARDNRLHAEALELEKRTPAYEDEQLSVKKEGAEVGGLLFSAMGLVLLIVGVALSTAAPELTKWLDGRFGLHFSLEATPFSRWLTVLGLALNVAGAWLMYRYPPMQAKVSEKGRTEITLVSDVTLYSEQAQRRFRRMSRFGVGLLGFGFLLQLCATIAFSAN